MTQDYAEAVQGARELVEYSVLIGDTRFVFPLGTTRAEAQLALDMAKWRHRVALRRTQQ